MRPLLRPDPFGGGGGGLKVTENEEVMQELYYSSYFLRKTAQINFLGLQLREWQPLLLPSRSASKNAEADLRSLASAFPFADVRLNTHLMVCGLFTRLQHDGSFLRKPVGSR